MPEGGKMTRSRLGFAVATTAAYLATIPTANWLVQHHQHAWIAPHLTAPAGVYMVGIALVLRDWARELAGRGIVIAAVALGIGLSYQLADAKFATASAAAFALSETLDFVVYEKLRERNLTLALAGSNAVGLVADSLLFLWLAFHSLAYLPGQLLGKAWMTALAVLLIAATRRRGAVA
jgi:uncharacterized PurR-regulated membrane protein YhhQ (DUF165 family)